LVAVFPNRTPPSRLVRAAVLLAAVVALAGCTSGGGRDAGSATTGPAGATAAPAKPLEVQLQTTARGPERGFDARKAAKRAAPGIERFLDRYLTVAFVDAQGGKRWDRLLGLFDKPVRAAARKQLDAVSLGAAAAGVTAVRPERASARATVLHEGNRPVAATVRLAFDGTADTAGGSGQLHLRSVLQLLRTGAGWQIAGFDSRTGPSS
jgi:hypothetical protein